MGSQGDSAPSTSGRGPVLPAMFQPVDAPSTKTLALTIAGAAVAGAVVWHFTRELYYSYVPPKVGLGRVVEGPQIGVRSGGLPQLPPPPLPPTCRCLPACLRVLRSLQLRLAASDVGSPCVSCGGHAAVPVPARHDDGMDGECAGAARQAAALAPPRARLPRRWAAILVAAVSGERSSPEYVLQSFMLPCYSCAVGDALLNQPCC